MSTTEATSYYNSLLSSASSTTTTTAMESSSSTTSLTSEDFLTLLLAEIQYQDPTEPMDNAEMVSQLTGYSQLDQLTSINEQLTDLTDSLTSVTASNSLDYIGKTVVAEGSTISKANGVVSSLGFTLDEDAASVTVNVYNSTGDIMTTETLSDLAEGSYTYQWDGLDTDGDDADDGIYSVIFTALDSSGASVSSSTTASGTVTGLTMTSDGVALTLSDGRSVNLVDVISVSS
ncbi:flagellar hook capping FlgD N-terminal domain-containing protein [Desulfovibrio aminophilus]|uniref:flagellar hook assembly protein FlgD n=1 Tax=Desulfovibrio aminophilus TaxID=81425 RepID=UPI0033949695